MRTAEEEEDDDVEHISLSFYRWQCTATVVWWIAVKALTGKYLEDVTFGSVITRPTWLSSATLYKLQKPTARKVIFRLSLLGLALGGWGIPYTVITPGHIGVRILAAILMSLYHLVESSVTCRHGEYPILYNVWAMCLPPRYASAVSWGIAIHFVMSTGIAKVMVGGSRHWAAPNTMKLYLTVYHDSKKKLSRPFFPSWNQWACDRNWATSSISISTILLECILVPSTLLLPAWNRWIGCGGMIFMHIGIFLFMSKFVGVVFATTLPAYIIGFQCSANFGTWPWWCTVAMSFGPTVLSFLLLGGPLPENWPSSPVSLFMWSGDQAKVLGEYLMTGESRVVLCTEDKTALNIIGLPVIHHGAVAPKLVTARSTDAAVHDCVLRVIGFTLLQGDLLSAVPRAGSPWNIAEFLKAIEEFLQHKKRLFESQSGQPLCKAYFVQLDSKGNVSKVRKSG